jgi:transcriptional regulator with XRE-family HTH domain
MPVAESNMRQAAGMTQRDLAQRLGREQNFVARVEQGQRRVDLVEFVWICRACGGEPLDEIRKIIDSVGMPIARRRGTR